MDLGYPKSEWPISDFPNWNFDSYPKSNLGYPNSDLEYGQIWDINHPKSEISIWEVRNQNSDLGYPKSDLGHWSSLGYNMTMSFII